MAKKEKPTNHTKWFWWFWFLFCIVVLGGMGLWEIANLIFSKNGIQDIVFGMSANDDFANLLGWSGAVFFSFNEFLPFLVLLLPPVRKYFDKWYKWAAIIALSIVLGWIPDIGSTYLDISSHTEYWSTLGQNKLMTTEMVMGTKILFSIILANMEPLIGLNMILISALWEKMHHLDGDTVEPLEELEELMPILAKLVEDEELDEEDETFIKGVLGKGEDDELTAKDLKKLPGKIEGIAEAAESANEGVEKLVEHLKEKEEEEGDEEDDEDNEDEED
ncbi:hypothetical protein M1271_00900 [Patescibacteria group bacterium]|nr:hypothetical protein [Patescibacteria group bacterium]